MEQLLGMLNKYRFNVNCGNLQPLLPGLCLILAVWLLWQWGASSQSFPIRHIKVESGFRYIEQNEIKAIVTPFIKDGFFHFKNYRLKDALLSNPWVANALVKRKWPDTVVIRLTERRPLVRWNQQGLISDEGHVFFPRPFHAIDWRYLPQLMGPESLCLALFKAYTVMNAHAEAKHLAIRQFNVSERQSWELILSNGKLVRLGREQQLERFDAFLQQFAALAEYGLSNKKTFDMRYPNGMAASDDESFNDTTTA